MEAEGIEPPSVILTVRLLIPTGCRLNEIMTLKWKSVDFTDKGLRLPDSKTGAKIVHPGQPAVERCNGQRQIGASLALVGDFVLIDRAGCNGQRQVGASLGSQAAPRGHGVSPVLRGQCKPQAV